MRWNALAAVSDEKLLQADWENAEKIGMFRAGKTWLFKKGAFGVSYVPYSEIVWAYRRIETVNGKLCCGKASFDIHHVRIVMKNGKDMDIRFEERKGAQELLDAVAKGNPETEIGYSAEKKKQLA